MNDSAIVIDAADPTQLEKTLQEAIFASAGDREGVRYSPEWKADMTLRTGDIANAFRIKETVLGPSAGISKEDVAQNALMRMFLQLLYGTRGVNGFMDVSGDSVVLTLSQRPDVWKRAREAAAGEGDSIGSGATIRSMRSWLLADPDFEVLIGVGTFGTLFKQLARAVPLLNIDLIPDIPKGLPPIAFDLSLQDGTIDTATVLPTGTLALVYDQIIEQLTQSFNTPDDELQ
jgi:hypothetical protein